MLGKWFFNKMGDFLVGTLDIKRGEIVTSQVTTPNDCSNPEGAGLNLTRCTVVTKGSINFQAPSIPGFTHGCGQETNPSKLIVKGNFILTTDEAESQMVCIDYRKDDARFIGRVINLDYYQKSTVINKIGKRQYLFIIKGKVRINSKLKSAMSCITLNNASKLEIFNDDKEPAIVVVMEELTDNDIKGIIEGIDPRLLKDIPILKGII